MHGYSFADRVHIDLDDRSYDIAIGAGLLGDAAAFEAAGVSTQALIVTNATVEATTDARVQSLEKQVPAMEQRLNERMDRLGERMDKHTDELKDDIKDLRGLILNRNDK